MIFFQATGNVMKTIAIFVRLHALVEKMQLHVLVENVVPENPGMPEFEN